LYTPIFVRWVEWLGELSNLNEATDLIRIRFKIIELSCKQQLFEEKYAPFIYQKMDNTIESKLSTQAERSLKKSIKIGFKIKVSDDYNSIQKVIEEELKDKHTGLTSESMPRLFELFKNAKSHARLVAFELIDDTPRGGVVCIESKDALLYLKGAVDEEAKKNGGMYLSIKAAIDYAKDKNLNFDFGGSRIEGVKKFNHNLGGQDAVYHAYEINKAPFWFNLARTVKKKWVKR
jgi:hypothetical protein